MAQSHMPVRIDSTAVIYKFPDYPFLQLSPRYSPISLSQPSNIKRELVYDYETKQYILYDRLGTKMYRAPLFISPDQFRKTQFKSLEKAYWKTINNKITTQQRTHGFFKPLLIESPTFNRIFGGNSIEIIPKGSIDVVLAGQYNTSDNPAFNERQRKQWGFDFDQNINLSLLGNIGEQMKMTANFNSQAQFAFENQVRFDYTGKEDAILKKLEIGHVSMPLNSMFIQGNEALFGIKTQLQLGKLSFTGLISQKRSTQKEIVISAGKQENKFEFSLAEYEANQHYFLGQYFRENYNRFLQYAPIISSNINITQIEVWVTNRTNNQENARDILALLDLGEYAPHNNTIASNSTNKLPSTGLPSEVSPQISNDLLIQLGDQGRLSNHSFVSNFFASTGGNDNYAKIATATLLREGVDYTIQRQLGYISLKMPLNQDQVLAVSYRYTADGKEYQVGDFSTDRPLSVSQPTRLYAKLLKNEILKTNLPNWNLMMKNIYGLHTSNIDEANFELQIFRTDTETGTQRPVIYEGQHTSNKSWLQLAHVDRLTQNLANGADGQFDYLDNITIDSKLGKIIFPVVEPLGKDLATQFTATENDLVAKYTFPELYSHTQIDAIEKFPNKNRYIIKGQYSASSGFEYNLGTFNLKPGTVKVLFGPSLLEEGKDYTVDYDIGTLRIINQALTLSNNPIRVQIEDEAMYGLEQKTLLGGRLDYRVNNNLLLGATAMRLSEKPVTEKITLGQEPISNSMIGFDIAYSKPSRWLTRIVDKLPFLSTKEESFINFYGEFAYLKPNQPAINSFTKASNGITYIDDFENNFSYIDLKSQVGWQLASTPKHFSESELSNNLAYGYNRALIALYNIDPIFYQNSSLNPRISMDFLTDHRTRKVTEQEVFPHKELRTGADAFLPTLDLAFYPMLRGPYNYSTNGINADGTFSNRLSKWGGLFKKIDQTDFEAQNIEFLELWMMDPTLTNPNKSGGDIYINLGNISEDILKDGRKFLENGMSPVGDESVLDQTVWGNVLINQPVTRVFENSESSRMYQDIGLDGLNNEQERSFHSQYLQIMQSILQPDAYTKLQEDPSSDDFIYFRGNHFDQQVGILDRYKHSNAPQGNSRTQSQSQNDFGVDNAARTLVPDGEDINRDNSMNESDDYYQYRLSIRPQDMEIGKNYVVDEVVSKVQILDRTRDVKWYKIRIPLSEFESKQGNIQDFKSIRFVRLFLTNFEDTAVVRLGKIHFVRGEWRKYNNENTALKVISDYSLGVVPSDNSVFHVANVNIEENGNRSPIPYVVPPGINRQVDYSNNNLDVQLNEQAISLEVKNLKDGYGRALYKTASQDFRAYRNIEMFIHAEGENLRDGDFRSFLRIGTDDRLNYYEYDIPLEITPYGTKSADLIWPEANRFHIELKLFQEAKLARDQALHNGQPWPLDRPYAYFVDNARITIVGSPDLSQIRYYMMGVRNPLKESTSSNPMDDGSALNGEFWFNELRLSDFIDKGGWAATAKLDLKLADFANVSLSSTKSTIGFGTLTQRVGERNRSENLFYDITSNAELGKFFHPKYGITIPFYFNYSNQIATPEYNPFQPDITLENKLNTLSQSGQDSLLRLVQDYTTRKSFSFNNVRKTIVNSDKTIMPWHIENFGLSYAYSEFQHRDFNTASTIRQNYRGSLDYTYSNPYIEFKEPLKNKINIPLLKDINFNLLPSLLNFRLDVNRIYNENTFRDNSSNNTLPTYYNKNFNMSRIYGISWDITKSLRLDFNATNYAIIDEPDGRVDGARRDTMWNNFWKMGRTADYNHMMNLTYTLPLNKIPYLEWLNVTTRYGTQFHWQSEPLFGLQNENINLGNSIQNNRTIQVNPTLNLQSLYQKIDFIRRNSGRNATGWKATLVQLLTSFRNLNAAYTKIEGTYLSGYNPKTNFLGYDFDSNAPGWGFLFGSQADILNRFSENNWFATDTLQTNRYTKSHAENLSILANLEPIKGLRIDLTAIRTDNYNINSTLHFDPNTQLLERVIPYRTGNYTISQIGLKSSFKNSQKLFEEFEFQKQEISQLLAENNIHSVGQSADFFADGYGKDQQDVSLNSLLKTYLGKDGSKATIHRKPTMPLPNWRVTFNNLAKLLGIEDMLSAIHINHTYQSQYIIGSYNTTANYQEAEGIPTGRDINNNFIPKDQYSSVSIVDRFIPLIGLNMRFANNLSLNSEYRRTRDLNWSFQNSQMSMLLDQSAILGMGFRKNNAHFPFGLFASRKWKNDMNFKMDFAFNDRKTSVFRSDINYGETAGGNRSITLNPSLDYTINNLYNIRIFYNSNAVRPYTSQNFATSYTYFGVNIRIQFQ